MCKLLLLNIKNVIVYNILTECTSTSIHMDWNPKLRTYSIIENLKQKHFKFLMRGIKKVHIFFIIRYSKVQKFLNFEKCLLVIFPWAGKFTTKTIFPLIRRILHKKDFHKKDFSLFQ